MPRRPAALVIALLLLAGCAAGPRATSEPELDLVVRGGTLYDGSGGPERLADIGVRGDRIVAVGDLRHAHAAREIDAHGLAVAPGFVNMLSWAPDSLLVDGRGMSDLLQGVTLEVFGEGWSMGPLDARMRKEALDQQGDLRYDISWTTLGDYLDTLEKKGSSLNFASFVGATTVRSHELGDANRDPTPAELAHMQDLVRQAMREGALGVGSALIYPPGFFAKTAELVALSQAAGESGGMYISHMRSEGNRVLEAIDELITIAREAHVGAEIYHLKMAGRENWSKLADAIARVEAARASGLRISADMYTFDAGATSLAAATPPWVWEGGIPTGLGRLRDPATRARVLQEMRTPSDQWENLMEMAGGAPGVLLAGFKSETLKPLTGKRLSEVAALRGTSPEDTALDLILEDEAQVGAIYFIIDEANIRKELALPWVSFGSDGQAPATEGVFLLSSAHPRTYGNFARLLGRFVRDEKILPLAEAIRRLTSLPAENLKLRDRGRLTAGYFADIVVFDPATIADHATYEKPHQYATGVRDVVVNGETVLRDGKHTGAFPGRALRGPGWSGWAAAATAAPATTSH